MNKWALVLLVGIVGCEQARSATPAVAPYAVFYVREQPNNTVVIDTIRARDGHQCFVAHGVGNIATVSVAIACEP